MPFFPLAYVFPGGSLEKEEKEMGQKGYALAGIRESREEVNFQDEIDPEKLVYLSRWITPPEERYRFDARFFMTSIKERFEVIVDGHEIIDFKWLNMSKVRSLVMNKEIFMPPPTLWNLLLIEQNYDFFFSGTNWKKHQEEGISRDLPPIKPEFKVFNEESRVIKFSGESIIGDYQKYFPEVPIIDLKWTKEGIEYFLK